MATFDTCFIAHDAEEDRTIQTEFIVPWTIPDKYSIIIKALEILCLSLYVQNPKQDKNPIVIETTS